MLAFDPTALDPANRRAFLESFFEDPEESETTIDALVAVFDEVVPRLPETTSEALSALTGLAVVLLLRDASTTGAVNGILGQTAIPTIATPDATDLATAQALANSTKATVNTLLAELRTAGILDT